LNHWTHPREVIDDRERTKSTAVTKRVRDEIDAPTLVRRDTWCWCDPHNFGSAPFLAKAQIQALKAVKAMNTLVADNPSLALQ
jgi:hypothetical protein